MVANCEYLLRVGTTNFMCCGLVIGHFGKVICLFWYDRNFSPNENVYAIPNQLPYFCATFVVGVSLGRIDVVPALICFMC